MSHDSDDPARALDGVDDPAVRAQLEVLLELVRSGHLQPAGFWKVYHREVPAAAPMPGAARALEGVDLARLPTFLVPALEHWAQEDHPGQRLWGLCDAVELLVRYLATVGLARQVRQAGGQLPRDLAQRLAGRIERPTFGLWLHVA